MFICEIVCILDTQCVVYCLRKHIVKTSSAKQAHALGPPARRERWPRQDARDGGQSPSHDNTFDSVLNTTYTFLLLRRYIPTISFLLASISHAGIGTGRCLLHKGFSLRERVFAVDEKHEQKAAVSNKDTNNVTSQIKGLSFDGIKSKLGK